MTDVSTSAPIFIGGLSYSGKTPLRLMLSSHSHLALSRRTYMWQRYYGRFGDLSLEENFERCLSAMLAHKTIQALAPDPARLRTEYWAGQPGYGALFALIHRHFAERAGRIRWGAQIGLIEDFAGVIFADFPGARMIHMIGDPRTRYLSAASNGRDRTGKAGWETARWLHSAGLARRNQERYPGRYLVVRSENLAADPEATVRAVCDFIDEPFEQAMLTMENAIRFGSGEESNADRTPVGKGAMARRDLVFTQAYAGRDIVGFGYDLRPVRLSLKEQILFNALDRPANLASMFAWRTLNAIRS